MKKGIYLDYASLSPFDSRLFPIIKKYSNSIYGNPSSITSPGILSKDKLEEARKVTASFLGVNKDEIFFTSGATEGNNLAILGTIEYFHKKGRAYSDMSIMISGIEHSSIMSLVNHLEFLGVGVIKIPTDDKGFVDLAFVKKNINKKLVLLSVMYVNNEIGTIEPIQELTKILREFKKDNSISDLYFHTDASQAVLYENMNIVSLGVDLLTIDANKFYGPRSIGVIYIKRGLILEPIIFGGGQEGGLRSGTENLPGIMAFAEALKFVSKQKNKEAKRLKILKDYCFSGLMKIFPQIKLNGDKEKSSPHILSVSIDTIDAEMAVIRLSASGIYISTKSSCLKDIEESHVLKAIGTNSSSTLRISFGLYTKKKDIDIFLKTMKRLNDKGLLKSALAQNV